MAIVLQEPMAEACKRALEAEDKILISAGTLAELLIVAVGRGITVETAELLARFEFDIIPVTEAAARRIGQSDEQWGRGMHPASLNVGDCFSYELAKERACRLLYVGDDFAKTDIEG